MFLKIYDIKTHDYVEYFHKKIGLLVSESGEWDSQSSFHRLDTNF